MHSRLHVLSFSHAFKFHGMVCDKKTCLAGHLCLVKLASAEQTAHHCSVSVHPYQKIIMNPSNGPSRCSHLRLKASSKMVSHGKTHIWNRTCCILLQQYKRMHATSNQSDPDSQLSRQRGPTSQHCPLCLNHTGLRTLFEYTPIIVPCWPPLDGSFEQIALMRCGWRK